MLPWLPFPFGPGLVAIYCSSAGTISALLPTFTKIKDLPDRARCPDCWVPTRR
jgi:rubredoxin